MTDTVDLCYPKSQQPSIMKMRNCSRGAPMGMRDTTDADPDFTGTIHLNLLKMSPCGAYCAQSGTYWGCATPKTGWMYRAWYYADVGDEVVHIEMFIRGITRRDAKLKVLEQFPKARFYK
jgi:hypothetical protein